MPAAASLSCVPGGSCIRSRSPTEAAALSPGFHRIPFHGQGEGPGIRASGPCPSRISV